MGVQCLTLAAVAFAASVLGPQVGGSECSKYLPPCTWAPGQSASCGVLLFENLLMCPLACCPGFSPKEDSVLFSLHALILASNVSLGAGFKFPLWRAMFRIPFNTPPSAHSLLLSPK